MNRRALKDSPRPQSDGASKGAVNPIEVGAMGCNSRAALIVCQDSANSLGQATTGAMGKHAC